MANNIDIKNFKGIKVEVNMDDVIERNAEKCVDILKNISPKGHRQSKNYASGWAVKKGRKQKDQYFAEVWNATNYQLTHLLENGHLITNKKGGVGWAEGNPHIQNALDQVKPQFLADMGKAEIDIDFE